MGNVWRGRGNGIEEKKEGLAAFQKLKFHYTFNYTSFFAFCFFCFFLFGCFLFFFFFLRLRLTGASLRSSFFGTS